MPQDALHDAEPNVGTVLKSTGSWYNVLTSEGLIAARIRGKMRLKQKESTNPVAVGDRVTIERQPDGTAAITEIHPRWSKLSRRAAGRRATIEHVIVANVEAAWCVQSVQAPRLNPGFMDRFIVMAETDNLDVGLIFNKTDLLDDETEAEVAYWTAVYSDLGYPVLHTSTVSSDGLDALRAALQNKINVISGPSGVGKSTLLNAIQPEWGLRTGEISEATQKGKHTTTHAELMPLPFGGYVADTPGLREFGIWDLSADDLSGFFVEMRPYLENCRFPNCTHDHEPDCAVKDAVEDGEITEGRYISYLNILHSLRLGLQDKGR